MGPPSQTNTITVPSHSLVNSYHGFDDTMYTGSGGNTWVGWNGGDPTTGFYSGAHYYYSGWGDIWYTHTDFTWSGWSGSPTITDVTIWGVVRKTGDNPIDQWVQLVRWDTINPAYIPPGERNYTINIKSTSSGLNIPRADVSMTLTSGSVSGQTDLNGNVSFLLANTTGTTSALTISKAGYNTLSTTISNAAGDNYQSYNLNDITWDGGAAQVYVDILDKDTKAGISSATVGIQNKTATIDQWTYSTVSGTTASFTKTGLFNLSVGQTVGISAFKPGNMRPEISNIHSHRQFLIRR